MPLTGKGKKIKKAMQEEYGEEEGERVFYASEKSGTVEGVHRKKKRKPEGARNITTALFME